MMSSYCCNLLFLTFALQIMSFWAISKSGYSLLCPVQSHWTHRANTLCNSSDSYVCVYNQNERNFREFCHNKAIIENKGYKVIFRGAIDGKPCERNFYQPFKFNSSGNSGCVYSKSVCTEEGQFIYKNENSQTDRVCRCDDSKGYAFIHRPQHRCYCVPSKEDCSCYFKKCSPGELLSKDYECLDIRTWDKNIECSTVIVDGTEDTSTVISTHGYTNRKGTTDSFSWITLIVTLLVLVYIGVICVYIFGIKQVHKRRDGLNENETSCTTFQKVSDLQDHFKVSKWRKMNEHFEVTQAAEIVFEKVKTQGFVIISGPPGSGKSAIAYNTAFMLEKNAHYTILPVSSPEEIRKYLLPATKQVFLIDDPVGKYTVDDSSIQLWEQEDTFIEQILTASLRTKLILTCRSYIYNSWFRRKFNVLLIHIDLLSNNMKLSIYERRQICKRYKIPELNEDTIMMYDFLPLLCSIYSEHDDTAMFVVNPNPVLTKEIIKTKDKSDIAFLAIALLVVQNNNIDRQLLNFENNQIKELLNDMCNECGLKYFPSTTALLAAFKHLIGTYVKEEKDGFACIHETLFQNLSFIVGSSIIHCLIKYGSSKFLACRLQLASLQEEHDELVIIVNPEQEELYFQRLMSQIRKGYHRHVFTGIQIKYPLFRSKLITFLKSLKDIDITCDDNNSTPLHVISEQGYEDLVFTLYQKKKDQINHQDKNKRTPLFMACLGGHDKIIQTILGLDNSSFYIEDNADLSPLDAASLNNHSSTAKLLLKTGAKVNRKDKHLKRTALQRACESGSTEVVNFLLTKNPDVNNKDTNGLKAIHIACKRGHLDIVKLLLRYKTMLNELDDRGRTPLFIACESNQRNTVDMLLQNKANVNQADIKQMSPLYRACQLGNYKIVEMLLNYSANVNAQSDNGVSPLYAASMKGELKCVEILLNKHAEIDLATKHGLTPLFISCSKGHLEICRLLLISGANINTGDENATTPLHVACREEHERIVRSLIKHDANVNAVDTKKESPLYIACAKECFAIV